MTNDTELHFRELLITLDYLLNYTDENHHATQQDICRHATKYGLVYNGGMAGDEIKRQRVGKCLEYLQYVTYKFKDKVPFVITTSNSGKYYVVQKNHLDEAQIIKVLAAVKNDRYTQDEDTEYLIETLLDSLSNVHNRQHYKDELKRTFRGTKKYNGELNRKIRLVNKAFNEGKMIKLRYEIMAKDNAGIDTFDFWYRVYKIREYNGKPYAFLLPINTGNLIFFRGYEFNTIENLNIPKEPDSEILNDDMDENRDLDKLFREKVSWMHKYYDSPEDMLRANKMPVSGIAIKTTFVFRKSFFQFIKPSFEDFFSSPMEYGKCASYEVNSEEDVKKDKKLYYIKPIKAQPGEKDEYYYVNTLIDPYAYQSWLQSDVHGNGDHPICNLVRVLGPVEINKRLLTYYKKQTEKMEKIVNKGD